MVSYCSSVSMILTWRFKGHELSLSSSKRSHTSIRTLERRSSLSEIRTGITLRSARSLAAKRRTICNADCSRSSLESAETAGDRLSEHKEYRNVKPKNTVCLWFDKDALEAARFYAATFPDSKVTAVHNAPGDYPSGKEGDVLTVEFTVLGIPCLGLNGGPAFRHSEAFSFQIATENQEETDRYWNAIIRNGGVE